MDNNITLARIGTRDPDFEPCMRLMNKSFVDDELRDRDDLMAIVESNPIFGFNVIRDSGQRVGLITTWNFGKFIYVEHFAIEPEFRGGGVGNRALAKLSSSASLPIVLEVEPPSQSDEARRRVAFYGRMGFSCWQTEYRQPAYAKGKKSIPMILMTKDLEETADASKIVTAILYRHVYKVKQAL